MGKEILTFGDIEIQKKNFYCHKNPDIGKGFVSYKISFGEKKNYKTKTLHIILPKTSAYIKSHYERTKWMYFLIGDDDLPKKYKNIWHKVSANIKKEFDSEPVNNKNLLKTKIKHHGDEVTDFYDKKLLR